MSPPIFSLTMTLVFYLASSVVAMAATLPAALGEPQNAYFKLLTNLKNRSHDMRPVMNYSDAVTVKLTMALFQVIRMVGF